MRTGEDISLLALTKKRGNENQKWNEIPFLNTLAQFEDFAILSDA